MFLIIGISFAFLYGALMSEIIYEAFCHHGPPDDHPSIYKQYPLSGLNDVFSIRRDNRTASKWFGWCGGYWIAITIFTMASWWDKGLTYGRINFNHPVSIPPIIG